MATCPFVHECACNSMWHIISLTGCY